MEETMPKEERIYTPQELDRMGYVELKEIAKVKGINYSGMNLSQLKFALGAAPEGAIVVDLKEGMPESILNQLREEKRLVPGKIIYTKDIEEQVWRERERNPVAFNNVNFTDKEAEIQHIFSKRAKCSCGEDVRMEKKIKVRRDNKEVEVTSPDPVYKKQCKCGKWYVYHPKEDVEIRGPIL
jgi:hypothetical protein